MFWKKENKKEFKEIGHNLYISNGVYYYDAYETFYNKTFIYKTTVESLFRNYDKEDDLIFWFMTWNTSKEHEKNIVKLWKVWRKEERVKSKEKLNKYDEKLNWIKSIK